MRPFGGVTAFLHAVGFLTRLPVSPAAASSEVFARSLAWFPCVGLALGVLYSAAAWLLSRTDLPSGVAAALLATLAVVATGGLHLDGLADVFDALGAPPSDRARALSIMRDSRLGTYGALALALALLTRWTAFETLLTTSGWSALVLAPVAGRGGAVLLIVLFPYAREQGLGASFRTHARRSDAWFALGTAFAFAAAIELSSAPALLAAGLLALGLGHWWSRRFAGLTGDTYGAAIELSELAFLVSWLLWASP